MELLVLQTAGERKTSHFYCLFTDLNRLLDSKSFHFYTLFKNTQTVSRFAKKIIIQLIEYKEAQV